MTKSIHFQKSIQIASENDILYAMDITRQLAEQIALSSNEQILLSLVTEEALVNAIEHCVKKEPVCVSIQWEISNIALEIIVTQPGVIFSIEKSNDVNMDARGRGLQLILHIMDKVWLEQLEQHVVQLHMVKKYNTKKAIILK